MAYLGSIVLKMYDDIYNYDGDPIAAAWPLVKSPLPAILIGCAYLLFVLKMGPSLMKNRTPFEMNGILIVYNGALVLLNIYVAKVVFVADNGFFDLLTMTDIPFYREARSCGCWWFYISKYLEMFDTVFMVLRRKQSQVTFFHVFHHAYAITYIWGGIKFFPGVQGAFHSFLNASVHIVMYTYYMFAACGPQYRKYLWWKKYLTQMQLAQFLTVFVYLIYVVVMDCNVSKGLTYYEFVNCVVFIYLFADFYSKEYSGSKKKKQQAVVNGTNGKLD